MLLVENDPALFDRADRQRVGELVELARREPGDVLKVPQSSGGRCTNTGHSYGSHSYDVSRLIRTGIRLTRSSRYSFDGIGYLCDRFGQAQLTRDPEGKLARDDRRHCLCGVVRADQCLRTDYDLVLWSQSLAFANPNGY